MSQMTQGAWSGEDFLLKQDTAVLSDGKAPEAQVGYVTSSRTRELVIAAVEEVLMDVGEWRPGEDSSLDPIFVQECLVFERHHKTGKPRAARGHDDSVFAEGFRELARKKLIADGLVSLASKARPEAGMDPIDRFYAGRELQRKREAAKKSPACLGSAF